MIATLKKWWAGHGTKLLGFLTFALSSIDMAGYAEPVKTLIGPKGYSLLLLISGVATVYRGFTNSQQPKPLPPPDPNASRP